MRNFNTILNMTRSSLPFTPAGSSFATRAITNGLFSTATRNKITLSGILNGAQKTIGTVNQIVPLYNQIKPMFQNSKVLLNIVKGLKPTPKKNRYSQNTVSQKEDTIIIKESPKEDKPQKKDRPKGNEPSKPFFL